MKCGVSNAIWLKKVMDKWKRRGVSTRATESSKYSLTPFNLSEVRTRRTERLREGGRRLARSRQDRGDRNSSQSDLRLVA